MQKIVVLQVAVTLIYLTTTVRAKKKPDPGVANINCPLDDDAFNPTHLQYLGDCTKFIKCSYGKGYTLSCPRGLHWSVFYDRCEAPSIAECDPLATTLAPVIGGGSCTYTYKPHPTDCTKGLQCADGKDIVLQCLEDMYWSPSENKCSYQMSPLC